PLHHDLLFAPVDRAREFDMGITDTDREDGFVVVVSERHVLLQLEGDCQSFTFGPTAELEVVDDRLEAIREPEERLVGTECLNRHEADRKPSWANSSVSIATLPL